MPVSVNARPWKLRCTALAGIGAVALLTLSGEADAASRRPKTQPPMTAAQCRVANAVADHIRAKYDGRISAQFLASLKRYLESNCDTTVQFVRLKGTADDEAYGDFSVTLLVYWNLFGKPK